MQEQELWLPDKRETLPSQWESQSWRKALGPIVPGGSRCCSKGMFPVRIRWTAGLPIGLWIPARWACWARQRLSSWQPGIHVWNQQGVTSWAAPFIVTLGISERSTHVGHLFSVFLLQTSENGGVFLRKGKRKSQLRALCLRKLVMFLYLLNLLLYLLLCGFCFFSMKQMLGDFNSICSSGTGFSRELQTYFTHLLSWTSLLRWQPPRTQHVPYSSHSISLSLILFQLFFPSFHEMNKQSYVTQNCSSFA